MTRHDGGRVDGEPTADLVDDPEAAFSVLGDETRLSILLALAQVASEEGPEATVSYATLRRRVGVTDSGRFNYHLDRLREGFIEKTDDGYRARYPGLQVVSTVYAGLYDEPEETTAAADLDCPRCGRAMEIAYEDATIALRCPEHGAMTGYPVPPGALEGRTLRETMRVALDRTLGEMESALRGVCQRCWGTIEATWPVDPGETGMAPEGWTWATVECDRCWPRFDVPVRTLLAAHPCVRSFYVEHGHDQVEAIVGARATGNPEVCTLAVSDGGTRATLTVELDDDALALTVDEDLTVVDQERR